MKNTKILLFTILMLFCSSAFAQSYSVIDSLFAHDSTTYSDFGNVVAMQDSFLFVGAERNCFNASGADSIDDAGAVYVFVRKSSGVWAQKQKIVASDRTLGAWFGSKISISGNNLVITAENDTCHTATAIIGGAGSAYIFERSSGGFWLQKQKIHANVPDTNAYFGYGVSIYGNYLVIGAYCESFDSSGTSYVPCAGAAYIYERNSLGVWDFKKKIQSPTRISTSAFGNAIHLNDTTLFVGQVSGILSTQKSRVSVFTRNTYGNWVFRQEIIDSTGYAGDDFSSIFANDTLALFGVRNYYYSSSSTSYGTAFVYMKNSSGQWIKKQKLLVGGGAGTSIAFSDNKIFVGCTYGSSAYSIYPYIALYERDTAWSLKQKIRVNPTRGPGAWSIAAKSGILCSGQEGWGEAVGTVYVFQYCNKDTTTVIRTACDSFSYNGEKYKTGGTYYHVFKDSLRCDSVIKLVLTLNYFKTATKKDTGCNSLTINGIKYDSTGSYTQKLTSVTGCDSILTLNILIRKSTSATWTKTVCDSLVFEAKKYDSTGVYNIVLVNKEKCDSLVTLELTVNKTRDTTLTDTACGEFWLNAIKYDSSGTYFQSTKTKTGCDSNIRLYLTILRSENKVINQTACKSFSFHDSLYTKNGTYMHKFTNTSGCDSIETLLLNLYKPNTSVVQSGATITAALGYTYQWIDCITGLPISGETNRSFIANKSGSYAVIVSEFDCNDTSDCIDVVGTRISTLGKETNALMVFPNPSKSDIIVSGCLKGSKILIFDLMGRAQLSHVAIHPKSIIDLSNLPVGIYLLKALDESGNRCVVRVIKE